MINPMRDVLANPYQKAATVRLIADCICHLTTQEFPNAGAIRPLVLQAPAAQWNKGNQPVKKNFGIAIAKSERSS